MDPAAFSSQHALLDHLQITVDPSASSETELSYRYRHCAEERKTWLECLPQIEWNRARRDRFRHCGSLTWVQWSQSRNAPRLSVNRCNYRWCPACRRAYTHELAARLRHELRNLRKNTHKFITLTIRHEHTSLANQLHHLKSSFRRLRARMLWKRSVEHGIAVVEITFNPTTSTWHPHLHILAKGKYIEQKQLSKAWKECTNGSPVVHIRAVHDSKHAVNYLSHYVAKPPEIQKFDDTPARLKEWYMALRRNRLVIRFGNNPDARGFEQEDDGKPNDWQNVCRLSDLLAAARNNNPNAIALLAAVERGSFRERHPEEPEYVPPAVAPKPAPE